jgi:hypothetical protein
MTVPLDHDKSLECEKQLWATYRLEASNAMGPDKRPTDYRLEASTPELACSDKTMANDHGALCQGPFSFMKYHNASNGLAPAGTKIRTTGRL